MSDAFSSRLSPETTPDENRKRWPILNLTLAMAPRTSVGVLATNEAETHRTRLVKLTAGGFSDSVMLSRVQTHDKTFDVSSASALHNFVVASACSVSQGIQRRLRKKNSGTTGEKHRKPKQACLSENVIAAILNSQGARRGALSANNSIKTKTKEHEHEHTMAFCRKYNIQPDPDPWCGLLCAELHPNQSCLQQGRSGSCHRF